MILITCLHRVKPITKFASMISNPTATLCVLQKAIYTATSLRKGPVWLDVPSDIQGQVMKEEDFSPYIQQHDIYPLLFKDEEMLFKSLKCAERPLLLIGNGIHVAGVKDKLNQFINKHQIPVVSTYLGIDLIDYDNSLYIGSIGVKGTRAGNFAVDNCDLLLVLGCALNIAEIGYNIEMFAPHAKICIVDIEEKKHIKPYMFINCDLKTFFNRLL